LNTLDLSNEQEYRSALKEISLQFDNEPEPGTPEAERFELMIKLIENHETVQVTSPLP